uniref:immunoglobulin superfamily containing leucine-rich repeat protein-like n=1 Tax=Myxine glutinosa TaxID=7769 RepID=UPI00358FD152
MRTKIPLSGLAVMIFLNVISGCPEKCKCVDKSDRMISDCAHKKLDKVPKGLPSNTTTLNLPANKLRSLDQTAFAELPDLSSLWLAYNDMINIEIGTLSGLIHLRNMDLSNNQLSDFPWADLKSMTALQMLKLNNNQLKRLPSNAFSTLVDLRSLSLNHNRLSTIFVGTFDDLHDLSYLLLHDNPLRCSCKTNWMKSWLENTTVNIPNKNAITCAEPYELEGKRVTEMPDIKCSSPKVHLSSDPDVRETRLYPESTVVLTCESKGVPTPVVTWKVRSGDSESVLQSFLEDRANTIVEESKTQSKRVTVLKNGTLIIPQLSKLEEGFYTCIGSNDVGSESSTLQVALVSKSSKERKPKTNLITSLLGKTPKGKVIPPQNTDSLMQNAHSYIKLKPNAFPSDSSESEQSGVPASFPTPLDVACAISGGDHPTRSPGFNHTVGFKGDLKQHHTIGFAVIALEVSDTDARVQLAPTSRKAVRNSDSDKGLEVTTMPNLTAGARLSHFDIMYLCMGHLGAESSMVKWSFVEGEVHLYRFHSLKPGTPYTLCLSRAGEPCLMEVPFITRKRIPSLLIMVVVSSLLLGLATIPLLAAACCHLLYQYRAKTYKPMEKEQQKQLEQVMRAHDKAFGESLCDSEKQGKAEGEQGSCDGGGSQVQPAPHYAATEDIMDAPTVEYDLESECSDRLPLGAEAVNIAPEINGNYKQPSS